MRARQVAIRSVARLRSSTARRRRQRATTPTRSARTAGGRSTRVTGSNSRVAHEQHHGVLHHRQAAVDDGDDVEPGQRHGRAGDVCHRHGDGVRWSGSADPDRHRDVLPLPAGGSDGRCVPTGGDQVGGPVALVDGSATSAASDDTDAIGTYCWRAEYSGNAFYDASSHTNATRSASLSKRRRSRSPRTSRGRASRYSSASTTSSRQRSARTAATRAVRLSSRLALTLSTRRSSSRPTVASSRPPTPVSRTVRRTRARRPTPAQWT